MNALAVTAIAAAGLPIALHGIWSLAHGYPPATIPRVLCFHKLSERFCLEGTWTTPQRFAAMLDRLLAKGWSFIGEAEFLASLETPRENAAREVFLTFDDGYTNLRDVAWPIVQKRKIPMHVFLVSDYAGRENSWEMSLGRPSSRHLDWYEVRSLASAGVTFGSHTAAHHDVTRLHPVELRADLLRSRAAIVTATGKPVRTLSYPFGRYHAQAQAAARAAGFEAAFSLYPKGRNARVDRYALRRNAVYIIDPVSMITRKLEPNFLYGVEEMKCRAINAVAVLTPLWKQRRPNVPDS